MKERSFYDDKQLIEKIVDRKIDMYGISKEIIGHLDYDIVECSNDEEERMISNILFQNTMLKHTGEIYYLPSLINDIEKVEQGFEFRRLQLSDEEYQCLIEMISDLKRHISI